MNDKKIQIANQIVKSQIAIVMNIKNLIRNKLNILNKLLTIPPV